MNTKGLNRTFAGLGEIVFDHIMRRLPDGREEYYGSRGGGAVWNVLSSLCEWGCSTEAIGVGGDDIFGVAARNELNEMGVDTSGIRLLEGRRNLLIFEKLQVGSDRGNVPVHDFTDKCFVCGHRINRQQRPNLDALRTHSQLRLQGIQVLLIDRLTQTAVDLAQICRKGGAAVVASVGRVSDFRFTPALRLARTLSQFDMICLPERVAASIERRTRLENIGSLMIPGSALSLVCVTKAEKGLTLYVRRRRRSPDRIEISGYRSSSYEDTAGAGDYFLAAFLHAATDFDLMRRAGTRWYPDVGGFVHAAEMSIAGMQLCLGSIGARGHLKEPVASGPLHEYFDWRGRSLESIRSEYERNGVCPVCLIPAQGTMPVPKQAKRSKANRLNVNVSHLVRRTLFVTERNETLSRFRELLLSLEGRTVYVTGTGGSFAAATFIASVLSDELGAFAVALRPFDYVRLSVRSACLIVVSHSGSTMDCQQAITHAYNLGTERVALVTGSSEPKLEDYLRDSDRSLILPYGERKQGYRERGFVSIGGTVCPCALAVAACANTKTLPRITEAIEIKDETVSKIRTLLQRTFVGAKTGRLVLDVFGGGWAWPVMLDIESKLVEGRLGVARLHESKDFSHGRFMSVLGSDQPVPRILITVGRVGAYERLLSQTLASSEAFLRMESKARGMIGALEVLIQNQYVIQKLAELNGLDISTPGAKEIPKDGLRLYHWRRPFQD